METVIMVTFLLSGMEVLKMLVIIVEVYNTLIMADIIRV
jgi:hypothetical protein